MSPDQEKILMNIDMRMRRIENVLVGDKDFKIHGIVDKVDYHAKKIQEFDKDKTKVIAGATVLGTIFGFLSSVLHKFITNH